MVLRGPFSIETAYYRVDATVHLEATQATALTAPTMNYAAPDAFSVPSSSAPVDFNHTFQASLVSF